VNDWRVIHGDCLDVLKTLDTGSVDAVVTDPPYGMAYVGSPGTSNLKNLGPDAFYKGKRQLRTRETVLGDDAPFDPSVWSRWLCVFTGAQHFYDRLPAGGSLHCWDKRGDYERISFADGDMIWCSRKMNVQVFRCVWRGLCRHVEYDQRIEHPTQKPVAVMRWMLDLLEVPDGATVLDPYMGSGTTGVACMQTGRNFIGIEISEDYVNIARRRISEAANHLFAGVDNA
jgi:site-specific DNA-methyltransferase (adenine-specific)/modification methylase